MKLTIGDYDVEIKAKKYGDKFNKQDTLDFLNTLAIATAECAFYHRDYFKQQDSIYDEFYNMSLEIHNFMEAKGAFKGLEYLTNNE